MENGGATLKGLRVSKSPGRDDADVKAKGHVVSPVAAKKAVLSQFAVTVLVVFSWYQPTPHLSCCRTGLPILRTGNLRQGLEKKGRGRKEKACGVADGESVVLMKWVSFCLTVLV